MQLAMISAKMMMPDMRSYFPCEQPDSTSWLRQCRYARASSSTMSAGLLVTSGSSSASHVRSSQLTSSRPSGRFRPNRGSGTTPKESSSYSLLDDMRASQYANDNRDQNSESRYRGRYGHPDL